MNGLQASIATLAGAGAPAKRSDSVRAGAADSSHASRQTLRGLDWLNFLLADVQSGVGPFLAVYLSAAGWNEQTIGIALTGGGIASLMAQTPAGALADRLRAKRMLIAGGVTALAAGALLIATHQSFCPVIAAQVLIGASSSIFGPTVVAISIGVVGRELLDRRQGRNQTCNSAGNVFAAVSMGLIGYYLSNRGIFFFVLAITIPAFFALAAIRPREIDQDLARGSDGGESRGSTARIADVIRDRPLFIFLVCAVLFHFANAAMSPLLGEMLSKGHGRTSMAFMSACVITTQVVVTLLASWSGIKAAQWGRKPLLLLGFGVLPVRGILYTLTTVPACLIAIQILDGIAAAVFGVVSVLVIADLTRGSGRLNLVLGAVTTAVGIGAALSQLVAGAVVLRFGYHVGFLFLAAIATVAFLILWIYMPETRGLDSHPGRCRAP